MLFNRGMCIVRLIYVDGSVKRRVLKSVKNWGLAFNRFESVDWNNL